MRSPHYRRPRPPGEGVRGASWCSEIQAATLVTSILGKGSPGTKEREAGHAAFFARASCAAFFAIVFLVATQSPSTVLAADGSVSVADNLNDNSSALSAESPRTSDVTTRLATPEDQQRAKKRYETYVEDEIQSALDIAIGPQRTSVRVSTTMDFDLRASISTNFAPDGTIVSQEGYREAGSSTTVSSGSASAVQPASDDQIAYGSAAATKEFAISSETVEHTDAPGKVLRMNVAVLVNAGSDGSAVNAKALSGPTASDLRQVRNVVMAAAGLQTARGDNIVVTAVPFFSRATEAANDVGAQDELGRSPLLWFATLAGFGLIAFSVLIVLKRRRGGSLMTGVVPSSYGFVPLGSARSRNHPGASNLRQNVGRAVRGAERSIGTMAERIASEGAKDPRRLAMVVKSFLNEPADAVPRRSEPCRSPKTQKRPK